MKKNKKFISGNENQGSGPLVSANKNDGTSSFANPFNKKWKTSQAEVTLNKN